MKLPYHSVQGNASKGAIGTIVSSISSSEWISLLHWLLLIQQYSIFLPFSPYSLNRDFFSRWMRNFSSCCFNSTSWRKELINGTWPIFVWNSSACARHTEELWLVERSFCFTWCSSLIIRTGSILAPFGQWRRTTHGGRRLCLQWTIGSSRRTFAFSSPTFAQLIKQVGPHLRRNDTTLRRAVPVEKRIACAIYALGSTSELRTVANLFGLGKSTTGELLHDFCSTIVDVFFHRLVKFPSSDQEIIDTIYDFLVRYDYPMCIGSVDGTHISVKAPVESQVDYFNYKKFHSIVMLASVHC